MARRRPPRYAKTFRGLFDTVVDIFEHGADVLALGPIADLRERCQRRRVRLGRVGREKRLDADPRRLRERHGSLDAVAQLPHIAGPGMAEQSRRLPRQERAIEIEFCSVLST